MASDTKYRGIARRVGEHCKPGHVLAVWVYLLEHGRQAPSPGSIATLDLEACADALGWPPELIAEIIESMREGTRPLVIGARLAQFAERQEITTSSGAKRQREYRKRRAATSGETVTRDVTRNARDTHDVTLRNGVTRDGGGEIKRGGAFGSSTLSTHITPSTRETESVRKEGVGILNRLKQRMTQA